jgi:hydroxymethylbilane synthase
MRALRVGTRGSQLARRQTAWVANRIREHYPGLEIAEQVITTRGDIDSRTPLGRLPQIGEKGLFTREIESALTKGEIDFAVHSLKDLPVALPEGLVVGAVPERANPCDALVTLKKIRFDDLPAGARVGTSSLRRAAQIRRLRPDLVVTDLRGNLDTRLHRLEQGAVNAVILAAAGLERMGWGREEYFPIPPEICLPAPGQGALAVEVRSDDRFMIQVCHDVLDDHATRMAVTAERAFLEGLGGGCQLPVGALAVVAPDRLRLRGIVIGVDGSRCVGGETTSLLEDAFEAGIDLARRLMQQGAKELLDG